MNIAENSKQYEFLIKIRDVGMAIVFRKADAEMILDSFSPFVEYFEDKDKVYKYIESLQKICFKINDNSCTPDNLLFELGQYTPYIIYDDEEIDEDQTSLFDDDSWLYN